MKRARRVELRPVEARDLALFFEHQRDPEAVHQAAFTAPDPDDRAAFDTHWARIRSDESIFLRTIVADGEVAGHVAIFSRGDAREVTYWVAREHWRRGIATRALRILLEAVSERPIHARVAADNTASRAVLKKSGFEELRRERAFAQARGEEIEELVFIRRGADPFYACPRCGAEGLRGLARWTIAWMAARCAICEGAVGMRRTATTRAAVVGVVVLTGLEVAALLGWLGARFDPTWILVGWVWSAGIVVYRSVRSPLIALDDPAVEAAELDPEE